MLGPGVGGGKTPKLENVVYIKSSRERLRKSMDRHKRNHLKQLEDESIFLLREVAAEFERPVILYSVGKDSSVLVHLARKAFYPGRIPFPLLHVDTGFKFAEMYEFRDEAIRALKRGAPPAAAGVNDIPGSRKAPEPSIERGRSAALASGSGSPGSGCSVSSA